MNRNKQNRESAETKTEKKQERLKCSKNLLKQFRNCDNRKFSDMLTGDETWVYMFEPQRMADNKQWRSKTQNVR